MYNELFTKKNATVYLKNKNFRGRFRYFVYLKVATNIIFFIFFLMFRDFTLYFSTNSQVIFRGDFLGEGEIFGFTWYS